MMSQDPNQNPYAGGAYASENAPSAEQTTIPKWIGILNIVFGAILLLCVAGYSLQLLAQGFMGTAMQENQKQMNEMFEQERQQQIEDMKLAEEEAEDEETAAQLRADREALEQQAPPKMPDMQNMFGMNEPTVKGAYIFDAVSGLLLNVMMLVSGIGLVNHSDWARKLAIWVAGLKVLRLIAICALTVTIIGPAVSEGMGEFVVEMGEMNPQAPQHAQPPVKQITKIYSTMFIVWAFILLVLGSIYPLISLSLLTRPHVVQACKSKQDNVYQADVF